MKKFKIQFKAGIRNDVVVEGDRYICDPALVSVIRVVKGEESEEMVCTFQDWASIGLEDA